MITSDWTKYGHQYQYQHYNCDDDDDDIINLILIYHTRTVSIYGIYLFSHLSTCLPARSLGSLSLQISIKDLFMRSFLPSSWIAVQVNGSVFYFYFYNIYFY